jgi:hypothetical protein
MDFFNNFFLQNDVELLEFLLYIFYYIFGFHEK